jgi:hypothetical protein
MFSQQFVACHRILPPHSRLVEWLPTQLTGLTIIAKQLKEGEIMILRMFKPKINFADGASPEQPEHLPSSFLANSLCSELKLGYFQDHEVLRIIAQLLLTISSIF